MPSKADILGRSPSLSAGVERALTELAKLEQSLRDRSRAATVQSDEARKHDRHSSRAFWSGVSEGYRMAAGDIAEAYNRLSDLVDRQ